MAAGVSRLSCALLMAACASLVSTSGAFLVAPCGPCATGCSARALAPSRSRRIEPRATRRAVAALRLRACDVTEGEGFRGATEADKSLIAGMVKAEKMNPLFQDPANFLIAQDDENDVVGIGQIRPLGKQYELASLVVREDMRGNGIGTALVNELLERHKARIMAAAADPDSMTLPDVFLLTLKSSTPFYSRMGFLEIPVSLAPMGMQMEAAAGSIVAKMAGGELTCMRYKFPATELKCSGSGTVLRRVGPGDAEGA